MAADGTLEGLAALGFSCREVPADDADRTQRARAANRNRMLRGLQFIALTRRIVRLPAARRTPTARPAARRPRASSSTSSADPGDPDPEPAPKRVRRFARGCGIAAHQVRWCRGCGVVAFAVDDYQRDGLAAIGFSGRLCPTCSEGA